MQVLNFCHCTDSSTGGLEGLVHENAGMPPSRDVHVFLYCRRASLESEIIRVLLAGCLIILGASSHELFHVSPSNQSGELSDWIPL
jgi:hypothetical protein